MTQAPTRLDIAAGIYDFNEPGRPGAPAANAAGQTVEPIIASARLVPWQWPDPPRLETPVEFFAQPGGAREATRLVPDLEVRVDAAIRNR